MAGTPEGKLKKKVKGWLRAWGAWFYSPVQMGMGVVGIPDHICCKPMLITREMVGTTVGVFVAVEVKAPGKRADLTPNQAARLAEIAAAGGITIVVDDLSQLSELGTRVSSTNPVFLGGHCG